MLSETQRLRGRRNGRAVEPSPSLLLLVFHGRFGHQLKVTQRTHEFRARLIGSVAHSVDRGVVAILGPRNGLGDVGVSVALGPFAVDVQFHPPSPLTVSGCAGCYLTQVNTEFKKHNKKVAMLPFGKCRGGLSSHEAGIQVRLAEELALVGAAVASLATAAVLGHLWAVLNLLVFTVLPSVHMLD